MEDLMHQGKTVVVLLENDYGLTHLPLAAIELVSRLSIPPLKVQLAH